MRSGLRLVRILIASVKNAWVVEIVVHCAAQIGNSGRAVVIFVVRVVVRTARNGKNLFIYWDLNLLLVGSCLVPICVIRRSFFCHRRTIRLQRVRITNMVKLVLDSLVG